MTTTNECMICYEELVLKNGSINIKCGHPYCVPCFVKHMRMDNKCAMCRVEIVPEIEIEDETTDTIIFQPYDYYTLIDERIFFPDIVESSGSIFGGGYLSFGLPDIFNVNRENIFDID
jgi:hypothetical protein